MEEEENEKKAKKVEEKGVKRGEIHRNIYDEKILGNLSVSNEGIYWTIVTGESTFGRVGWDKTMTKGIT